MTPGARCGELLSSVHCYGLVWLMVESMTPSNPVYTSLVTLPKSGEWKTKACSFPYFFVLLLNYSTLSRLFYIRGKWSWFCMYRFTSFGWWLICLSYYFLIVFGSENNWKDTNFLSFENIKKIKPCQSVHLISFTMITLMLYPPHHVTDHWLFSP